ncbi:MAG: glycosyltransferase 61 family protein [Pseudomonadota bacterium]
MTAPPPVDETALLPHTPGLIATLLSLGTGPATGGWDRIEPPGFVAGLATGDVRLVHLRKALWSPRSGLIALQDGSIPDAPAQQVPDLAAAHAALRRAPVRRVARGAVWVSGGSARNYGHFLMDSLTGLAALDQSGLLTAFPPVTPALTSWQTGLIRAAGIKAPLPPCADQAIAFDEVIYLTTLGHYLQRNGALLQALIARMVPDRGEARPDGDVVYLSRQGYTGRILVNEPALQRALVARGVKILHPERLTAADQIAAMRRARLVIGASGAALANLCFLPRGAGLVEIRPATVVEMWLTLAAAQGGISHRVIPAQAPLSRHETPLSTRLAQLPRRVLGRYHYAYRVDIARVLACLD